MSGRLLNDGRCPLLKTDDDFFIVGFLILLKIQDIFILIVAKFIQLWYTDIVNHYT